MQSGEDYDTLVDSLPAEVRDEVQLLLAMFPEEVQLHPSKDSMLQIRVLVRPKTAQQEEIMYISCMLDVILPHGVHLMHHFTLIVLAVPR